MSNIRIHAALLIVVIIAAGALAFFATETRNWTLLVLVGYGTFTLITIALLVGIRYLARKVRTEGRNSRGEVELLRDAALTLERSLEKNAAQLEQSTQRIMSKLDNNDTAISQQRKEMKAATASTVDTLSAHEKILRKEFEVLRRAGEHLVVVDKHVSTLQSQYSDLSGEILNWMRRIEGISVGDLKEAKDELISRLREAERKLSTNTATPSDIKKFRERLEASESRILGTLESEAFQHGAAIYDHTQAVERLKAEVVSIAEVLAESASQDPVDANSIRPTDPSQLREVVSTLRKHITTTVRDGTRQVESLLQLAPYFTDKKMPLPSTGNFAIDSQALAHLITLVNERRPMKILELGSGTSTIWLGYLCKSYGGKIISLDHLSEYLEHTKVAIDRHELNEAVEVRLAPLEEIECHGEVYNWYSKSSLIDLVDIDLVVIDGPPAATGKMARYPALPEIVAQLSSNATVVLDDAHREEESSIIDEWLAYFPEFRIIEPATSRLAVLQRGVE